MAPSMEPAAGGTPPARPRAGRLGTALRQAVPLLPGVGALVVAAVPAVFALGSDLVARGMGDSMGAMVHIPGVGGFPAVYMVLFTGACLLESAGTVLLLPVAGGRRGLDFRFLVRHLPTALLAAALLLGLHAPYVLGFASVTSGGMPPAAVLLVFRFWWVVLALAPVGLAWFVVGRIEREAGREHPRLLDLAGAGLLLGLATAVVPDYVVREWLSPDPDTMQGGRVPFVVAQVILQRLVVVLGQLWFLRYLVLGRPQEESPASAT